VQSSCGNSERRMNFHVRLSFLLIVLLFAGAFSQGAELRLGLIGCDTSHATAFTEILNNDQAKDHVSGAKVVAAYKSASADIPSSASRVDQYAKTLREQYGVRFYDSISDLCANVDAVLIESTDGRAHLAQAKEVITAHKPFFIDKPMAASLHDVIEIFRLARNAKVPVFTSSALRFAKDNQAVAHGSIGGVQYCETYSPCELEPHHPELFWYGVHGVESLFTVIGIGCKTVQRGTTRDGKIEVIGTWSGGRTGIYREDKNYRGLAKGQHGEAPVGSFDGYAPLVQEIVRFFQTGLAPVKPEETIEIFAFMQAEDESKAQAGKPVRLRRK